VSASVYFAKSGKPRTQPTLPAYMVFGGEYTQSEENLRATPPSPLLEPGVQKLAYEMLMLAWGDLWESVQDRPSAWKWQQNAGYRPDPASARRWFAREDDAALGFVWCCYALRVDPRAVRKWVFTRKAKAQRHGVRAVVETTPSAP
jgi:hypothetical protein